MNIPTPPASPAFSAAQTVYGSMFDPEVRRRIRADPRQYALDNGLIDGASDIEIKVLTNNAATMYLAVSPAASGPAELSADELQSLSAAGTNSTAGSGSTASTLGTLNSTASSSTTLSTLATGGSS
ncbi:MAG: hypothetical protein OXU62_09665 [Gammaproteobacteria bacterium]|nr:hypothetical protein [Gammaproteobacteria bacterium]